MIDQKDIEKIRMTLKYPYVDLRFSTLIQESMEALSRIEAEAKEGRMLCPDCQDTECLGSPHPERCDFATVKENLPVQDARELVYKIRRMRNERREYCQWVDDGVPEITTDDAVKLIEARDSAVRADERKRCGKRVEEQFAIYEHTYDCEEAVMAAILTPSETPAGEKNQKEVSEEDDGGLLQDAIATIDKQRVEITALRSQLTELKHKFAQGCSNDTEQCPLLPDIDEIDALRAQLAEWMMERDALMDLKYYIDNPSAWTHFDQSVSDAILRTVATIDPAARAAIDGKEKS